MLKIKVKEYVIQTRTFAKYFLGLIIHSDQINLTEFIKNVPYMSTLIGDLQW